jgi:hypothetical protein
MEGRQRRSFTDDYKRQAVDLVASSGRSIGSVAKELGLRDSVLRRWVELRGAGRERVPQASSASQKPPQLLRHRFGRYLVQPPGATFDPRRFDAGNLRGANHGWRRQARAREIGDRHVA